MKNWIMATALMGMASFASAEYLVVAPKANAQQLSKDQVCDLFLSKENTVNGTEYKVYLPDDKDLIEGFYNDVCGQNIAAVRRKWAQLVFSGRQKVSPPGKADSLATFVNGAASPNELVFVSSMGDSAGKLTVVFRQ